MLAAAPVPPLAADQLLIFLLQVGLLLVLALTLGRLATRIGMPAVLGELLAGVLLGPSVLGYLAPALFGWLLPAEADQVHLLDATAQIAVLLLVGITGVTLDLNMLRRRKAVALRVSLAGLIVPLGLGIATGYLMTDSLRGNGANPTVFALFLGVAMCVSAIPVIAKTLTDMGLLHRDIGQLTLAAGMFSDAAGWFLLSVVSAMATAGLRASSLTISFLYLIGFVVLAWFVGRPLVRLVLKLAARSPEPGPLIATTTVVIMMGGAVTHALGMEAVFGAFTAGVLVRLGSPAEISRLAPLRTVVLWVLAPIFLASTGLRMDLATLGDRDVLLAAAVILTVAILGKFVGGWIGARMSGLNSWEGLALGAGMNARGVVEIVVASVGLRLGVLDTSTYTIIVLLAISTSAMAPPLLRLAMDRVEHTAEERLRKAEEDEIWSGARTQATPGDRATPH